jgi:hypothetical protein
MTELVRVKTKSAWLSKINWTQAIGIAASALVFATGGKVDIPLELQAQVVLGIQAVQAVATWVLKTWFTPTVTPASATAAKTITLD